MSRSVAPGSDEQLIEALGAYYAARDSRQPFDVDRFLNEFPDIRDRLEDFLAGADFLERHWGGGASRFRSSGREAHPAIVGDYEIEAEVGRGGMGIVYRARQRSTRRRVALKMIRPEKHPAAEAINRFQVEIHAVAALDHPNVVPIYEVGAFDGRPFYTMKLLEGGSLHDHLGEFQKSPVEAAQVVLTIARALEEAHTRGILHRDVKPQNILLDSGGKAYLTDFGLAKLCDGNLTLTNSAAALGSPHYMAPEQAGGRSKEITTTTDVYGLGATLYALLTGRPPFETDSFFDVVHLIQTTEPESPSRINADLPADLVVICLKCLRKERAARYSSCADLADDLQAFLRGDPIRARPVGRIGHALHWCRQNRGIAALSAVLACALVVGLAASTRFWRIAETRLAEMTIQKNRAESSYRLSRAALDKSVRLVIDDPDLRKGPLEKVRIDILSAQLQFHEQYLREHGPDPAIAADVAASHYSVACLANEVGDPDRALTHFREALAHYETLARDDGNRQEYPLKAAACWNSIAEVLAQQETPPDKVEEAFSEARRRLERIILHSQSDLPARLELADTLKNLGNLRRKCGRAMEAVDLHGQAVQIVRPIWNRLKSAESQQLLAAALNELGFSYESLKRIEEALNAYVEAESLYTELAKARPDEPNVLSDLAYAHSNIASVVGQSDPGRALEEHRHAIQIWRQLANDHPQIAMYKVRLAENHNFLGDSLWGAERQSDAEAAYRTALQMLESLENPGADATNARKIAGYAHQGLGHVLAELSRADESAANFRHAAEIYGSIARDFPKMNEAFEMLVIVSDALASLESTRGQFEEARHWIRSGIDSRRQLLALSPKNLGYEQSLAMSLRRLVDAFPSADSRQAKVSAAREAIAANETLLTHHNVDRRVAQRIQHELAQLHIAARQYDEAERAFRLRIQLCRERLERNPGNRRSRRRLIEALRELAGFLENYGTGESAEPLIVEAIRIAREEPTTLLSEGDVDPSSIRGILESAELAQVQRQPESVLVHTVAALAALSASVEPRLNDDVRRSLEMNAHSLRANALSALHRRDEAVAEWDRVIELEPAKSAAHRINRACDLARLGRIDDVLKEIDEVVRKPELNPGALRLAASALAISAAKCPTDDSRSSACVERALQLLARAIDEGYRNVRELDGSSELAIVRTYPEFVRISAPLRNYATENR